MTTRTRMSPLRPFTMRVINPLTRRVAGRRPGFGILVFRGRTSGRTYRAPINAFRRGDAYVFALPYGSTSQWVKNVLAAGSCTLHTRGRDVQLADPELFSDPSRRLMPLPARVILGLND